MALQAMCKAASVSKRKKVMNVYQKKYDIGSKEEGKAKADIRRHGGMEATMLVLVVGTFS